MGGRERRVNNDPRDMIRLSDGYKAGDVRRMPAACALRAISRLLPGQVRAEDRHLRRSCAAASDVH